MARNKQDWQVGDTFMVPLADASFAAGHIVAREPQMLNSVTCAFYEPRITDSSPSAVAACLTRERLIACLFTMPDPLFSGIWRIVGHQAPAIPARLLPFEHKRGTGWIGARIIGSGNVTKFLNAFRGLAPWDGWADPQYLDRLLIHPSKKPTNVLLGSFA